MESVIRYAALEYCGKSNESRLGSSNQPGKKIEESLFSLACHTRLFSIEDSVRERGPCP